jgi:hypothetical protein
MRKGIIFIIVLIIIAGIFWILYGSKKNNIQLPSLEDELITYNNASADLIKVELPFPGAVTGKSFSVIGEARGTWFFEASFPIQLFDKDGELLATAIAQAQEDWMTEEFVPFRADITAPESYIGEATLVLKKDNPSGLPNKDASISFKITVEY